MKALIFDSSAIITLALNDLLRLLEPLKKEFNGKFYITNDVKHELINRSLKIKRFMLEALMIKELVLKGILTIPNMDINKEKKRIMNIINSTFKTNGEFIRIMHDGEASCLALYNLLNAKKKAIVVDERTTRMLCEAPENLHKLLEKKLHRKVFALQKNFSLLKNINVIRTSELCFIAYKKGMLELPAKPQKAIEALLYAFRYKGCAISRQEINVARKL